MGSSFKDKAHTMKERSLPKVPEVAMCRIAAVSVLQPRERK
jgi:hypothetical protein